ncbi:MAG: response regulator transcription factor [Bacteroidota bacterium]
MSNQNRQPVILANFQFLAEEAITSLLNRLGGFYVSETVEDASSVMSTLEHQKSNLLIFDVYEKGTEGLKEIEALNRLTNTLVITNVEEQETVQYLLEIGVKGIVTKGCSEQEITNAIKAVSKGDRFFCTKMLNLVFDTSRKKESNHHDSRLSERELEVLKLIAEGNTTQQIATKLHISIHTVNAHRKKILKKLNIKSPIQLVTYAIENGLVSMAEKKSA